jgi:hypothetical protein
VNSERLALLTLKILQSIDSQISCFTSSRGFGDDIFCQHQPRSVLRGLPAESFTEEEQEFMKTMADVDAWYEAEIAKAEQRKQQEIAANLLRKNIPLDTISEATGLTIEQLQKLRSN